MKILIDIRPLLGSQRTGIPLYTLNLLRHLVKNGAHEYALFCNSSRLPFPSDLPPSSELVSHQFSRWPNRLLNLSFVITRQPKLERLTGDFDLAYLPDLNYFATKRPYILTIHDLSSIRRPDFFSPKHRLRQQLFNLRHMLQQAKTLIAVSEHTKEDLIEMFGLDERSIKIVSPGVDTTLFRPLRNDEIADIQKKYALPERFIFFLATLEQRKNVTGIIEAFDQAKTEDASLILAGTRGWKFEQILQAARSAQKSKKIKFLGYVSETDKPALYSAATAFVYPSFYEGFGMPVLEALACGTPVITSSTTSLPEVVGNAGLLVNPERIEEIAWAIEVVLYDSTLRRQLCNTGPIQAANFSWEKSANKLETIFNQINN